MRRARGSLLWERLWPALAALATAFGLFLAFSWAGLWIVLPPLGRAIGLVVFALLTLAAAVPLIRLRLPSLHEGLRRLDRGSGQAHRPATTIADRIAANQTDPVSQALWRAHVERALMSARRFKAGWPQPRLSLRDPIALRALGAAAGGGRPSSPPATNAIKRVAAAFDWSGVVTPANFRIDAWVTPPVYTGRPPVMLPGYRPGDSAQAQAKDQTREIVSVPAGSQLVVRATGGVRIEIARAGGVELAPPDPKAAVPQGSEEQRFVINGDGSAVVHGAGNGLAWQFSAIPDKPPTIELIQRSRAAGARLAAARLPAAGRLRRGRRAGDLHAQGERRRQGGAAAVRPARITRWRCRRRAPAPARRRPSTTSPITRGPAPRSR